jgi:hypothetical protein
LGGGCKGLKLQREKVISDVVRIPVGVKIKNPSNFRNLKDFFEVPRTGVEPVQALLLTGF